MVSGWHTPVPVPDAVERHLPSVITRTPRCGMTPDEMAHRIGDVTAWTTWTDIAHTVTDQAARLADSLDPSVAASIQRLTTAVTDAVERHG